MVQLVIYNDLHAGRCIFRPTDLAYQMVTEGQMTMDQVAAIAVPTGRPYAFIDSSDLPEDWSSRDTWFVDDADLADGVGGAEGVQADGLFKPREEEAA